MSTSNSAWRRPWTLRSLASRVSSGRVSQPTHHADPGWPATASPQAARLRSAWFRRSLQLTWGSLSDWWHPACDAVVEALADGVDARAAVRRLGSARAELGASVEEAMEDLLALWQVHRGSEPPARTLQALAAGWAEKGLEPAGAASCSDAVTGMATRAHLESRLLELYRVGALGGTSRSHQLLVLDVGPSVPITVPDQEWAATAALCRGAEALRRVFTSGELLVRLAPGRVAALTAVDDHLTPRMAALEGLLAAAGPHLAASVWLEALPGSPALVPDVLVDLAR